MLSQFSFNSNSVRIINIDGEPWFVLADVCYILEIQNPTQLANRIPEKNRAMLDIGVNIPKANAVNEPGLYEVIFRSDKPNAREFQDWVFSDVLPSIRKTGKYELQKQPAVRQNFLPGDLEANAATRLATIHETIAKHDVRLAQVLIDRTMRDLDAFGQPDLPPSLRNEPSLSGCVEIATELGFIVGKEESQLGRTIAKAYRQAGLGEPKSVKRECGGGFRLMKVYPKNEPVVIEAIKSFYQKRESIGR